jgi:hypothetical protein
MKNILNTARWAFKSQRGSLTIEQTWVQRFHDQLLITYQQKGSELQSYVDPMNVHRDVHGAIDYFDRMGLVIANDVVSPFGATQILNQEHSRRSVTLQSSDAALLVSDEHTLRAMIDPQNPYLNSIVWALGRRADKHLIDAALGSATVPSVTAGTGIITYTTQALPSARKIGGATAMDLTRIVNASELLTKAGVTYDGGRFMWYSPGQERNILAITQASSSDFTRARLHDKGTIDGVDWEGFHWKLVVDVMGTNGSTVLQRMLPLTSTTRSCIAGHKTAMGISHGRDIQSKINERPDLNNSIQVRGIMMMAAVRLWEGGIVQVDCLEN